MATSQTNSNSAALEEQKEPRKQPRLLTNPQTKEMQQKFTIDKTEYQSVFRVIDTENTGFISVEQVNSYLGMFEQMH